MGREKKRLCEGNCKWLFVFLSHAAINRQLVKYLNPHLPESNCSTSATLSAPKAVVRNGWMGDCYIIYIILYIFIIHIL